MGRSDLLGQFETYVMNAVGELGKEQAFGWNIFLRVCERAEKTVNLGALYVTLERLTHKKYLTVTEKPGGPNRGGRPKQYYELTPAGTAALDRSIEAAERVAANFHTWRSKWRPRRIKAKADSNG